MLNEILSIILVSLVGSMSGAYFANKRYQKELRSLSISNARTVFELINETHKNIELQSSIKEKDNAIALLLETNETISQDAETYRNRYEKLLTIYNSNNRSDHAIKTA